MGYSSEPVMTVRGTYGGSQTPADIFIYGNWYVIDGSKNVNRAPYGQEWYDGIDVEEIADVDTFTWSSPIESEEELVDAVEFQDEDEEDDDED